MPTPNHLAARIALVICILSLGAPTTALAGTDPEPVPTTENPPETDAPVETTPATEPDVAAADPAGDSDDDNSGVVAAGIVGFVIVVAIAAWWMISRSDPDRDPQSDDGWPAGEVP